jgi:predicted permease
VVSPGAADWRGEVLTRLRPLDLSPAREAEITEELVQHLEDRFRELVRGGENDTDARRIALADLDATGVLTERLRRIERRAPANPPEFGGRGAAASQNERGNVLSNIKQDLSYALRTFRRQPGFALSAIVMLAVGVGANTAIFALINGLLLRPLSVARPDELVGVFTSDYSGPKFGTSAMPDFEEWRDTNTVFASMLAYTLQPLDLATDGTAERLWGEAVTANYFGVIDVPHALGRGFSADADTVEGSAVVVISHELWQRRYNGALDVIGKPVMLNGKPFTLIGVARAEYPGLTRGLAVDLWIPLAAQTLLSRDGSNPNANRGNRSLFVMGRLKPGATIAEGQTQFNTMAAALYAAHRDNWTDVRGQPRVITLLPESQARFFPSERGIVLGFFAVLMVVVALVLLIACANVANLLLARAVSRSREIATRLALGASRRRIVQQLLTEGALLSIVAGAGGVLIGLWTTRLLMSLQPPVPLPVRLNLSLDARVLALDLVLIVLTTIIFGLVPALAASRPSVMPALKDATSSVAGNRSTRLRQIFVVTQVTVSLVLLVGSGLFLRSLQNVSTLNPGFDPNNVAIASVDLEPGGYEQARGLAFLNDTLTRLRAMPTVTSASLASALPLGLGMTRRGISVEGYVPKPGEDMEVGTAAVAPDYFKTMRSRIVTGREFQADDKPNALPVAIVNDAFARRFWPGENPIGKRIANGTGAGPGTVWLTVVGVEATGKYRTLGEDPTPFYYNALLQRYEPGGTFVIRTTSAPESALRDLRALVNQADKSLPLLDPKTLNDHLGLSLLPARLAGSVLGVMGTIGLLLAAAGLYGVIAYAVTLRTREIGVRLSLGASRGHVFMLIVRQGLMLTSIGCAIGLALALGASQALTSLLYGLSPTDPVTFISVVALFMLVAGAACVLPAWRAMRVDPLRALRQD